MAVREKAVTRIRSDLKHMTNNGGDDETLLSVA